MNPILKYCFGCPEVAFESGAALITEGKSRGPLFILVEGCVKVLRGDVEVARVDTPGAIFGEMAVLLDMPCTATVTAVSEVRAYIIEQPKQFIESRPQITLQIAGLIARRLNDATTYLVEANRQLAGSDGPLNKAAETVESIVHSQDGTLFVATDPDPATPA